MRSRELTGHKCGACGQLVFPAIFQRTGLRMHLERTNRGDLELVPELPGLRGASLPHVAPQSRGRGSYREHKHDAFSASSFSKKARVVMDRSAAMAKAVEIFGAGAVVGFGVVLKASTPVHYVGKKDAGQWLYLGVGSDSEEAFRETKRLGFVLLEGAVEERA